MKCTPIPSASTITASDQVLSPIAWASRDPIRIPTIVPSTRLTALVTCSPVVFAPMKAMNTAITAQ